MAAPYTKPQLKARIDSFWPDNTTRYITPARARQIAYDIVDSYVDEGTDITGSGTNGKITKWVSATEIADSIISESGSTISIAGDLNISGLTASRVVITDSLKKLVSSSVTAVEFGYVSGVTSSIQAQIDSKEPTFSTLPTSKGGTGTSTTFTESYIIFAGPSGNYAVNNSGYFTWDDVNLRFAINSTSDSAFYVASNGTDTYVAKIENDLGDELAYFANDGTITFGNNFSWLPTDGLTIVNNLAVGNLANNQPTVTGTFFASYDSTYGAGARYSLALDVSTTDDIGDGYFAIGIQNIARLQSQAGGTNNVVGIDNQLIIESDTNTDNIVGISHFISIQSTQTGTVDSVIGIKLYALSIDDIAPTTTKGIFIEDQGYIGTTTSYAIHIENQTGSTHPYGIVNMASYNGFGQAAPTAYLHIGAGTTGLIPFKFTSGTNATTAAAGGMEYNGTNLFFTRTGTTRETLLSGIESTLNVLGLTAISQLVNQIKINIGGSDYYVPASAANTPLT